MNYPNIRRESVLNPLLELVKDCIKSNHSGIIELYGNAGCGKTTVLNQIEEYFSYYAIFPHINQTIGYEQFSLISYLTSLNNNHSKPKLGEDEIISHLIELLLQSRNFQKDIQIFIIDDSHLLPKEVINQLKLLFNTYSGFSNYFLILSGREKKLNNNSIEIGRFSKNEINHIFQLFLNKKWVELNTDIYHWIIKLTDAWPFYLILFLEWGLKIGTLSKKTQKPLDQIISRQLPENLLQSVNQRYNLSLLSVRQKEIIEYISFSTKQLSFLELASLISIPIGEVNNNCNYLENEGWINENNQLYHSLIGEMVIGNCENIQNINENFILKLELPLHEQASHILKLNKLSKNHKLILEEYGDEIESEGLFYSAIKTFEKIDPKKQLNHIQFKIAINLYRIGKNNQSKEILENLITDNRFNNSYKVYYYLGRIYFLQNKLDDVFKIINLGLKNVLDDFSVYKLKSLMIELLVINGSKDEVIKLLNEIQPTEKSTVEEKLEYYILIAHIHHHAIVEVDVVKIMETGIELAEKHNKNSILVNLNLGLMRHYALTDNVENALFYAEKAFSLAKGCFELRLVASILLERGQIYVRNGKAGIGIKDLETAIEMNKNFENIINTLNPISQMAGVYEMLNHIPKSDKTHSNLSVLLKENDNFDSLLGLGIYYQLRQNYSKSIHIYNALIIKIDKINNENIKAFLLGVFYPTIFSKDEKQADKNFNQAVNDLIRLKTIYYLHAPFHAKGWVLINSSQENNLSSHLQKWVEIIKDENEIPLDFYQPLMIINEITQGEKQNALHRLRRFESRFEGANILQYKNLYDWLIKENTYPKFTNRYKVISELIYSITHVDKKLNKISVNKSDKFLDFLIEWQRCIHEEKDFEKSILNRFVQNESQKDCLLDALIVWDISLSKFEDDIVSHSKLISIQLLGQPNVSIEKVLINKDLRGVNKPIELFIYLILKGWRFNNQLSKERIASQLWDDDIEDIDSNVKKLNITLSRLRKSLNNKDNSYILNELNSIGFNWDYSNYRLDIDDFYQSYNLGKDALNNKELDKGISYLKHAINVYGGYLCNKLKSEWIDEIRATFHNYYLDCLIILSDKLSDKEKQKLVYSEQLKFPDEEIEEYFD